MGAQEIADRSNRALHKPQVRVGLGQLCQHFFGGVGHVVRIAHVQAVL
jgi:hypothetical protein